MSETAAGIMALDHSKMQREARTRAIAISSASRALDEIIPHPYDIEDPREFLRLATRAIEMAAYYAVEKVQELHAEEMKLVDAFYTVKNIEGLLHVPHLVIEEPNGMGPISPDAPAK